jgi:PelA/Pel-15E family pectate lyase
MARRDVPGTTCLVPAPVYLVAASRLLICGIVACMAALAACRSVARGQEPGRDATAAGAAEHRDTTDLLSARRIAALPPAQRDAWTRYIEESRRLARRDRSAMEAELRAAGLARMTRAPHADAPFDLGERMTDEWFRGDTARRIADNLLSFQTPSGGWSKRTDFSRPRRPGESYYSESDGWTYVPTIDNGATTGQLLFLARAYAAHGDARYRDAYLRGLDYLLRAQAPNGCWLQVYPLAGGYHDAITFNDDAIVNVLAVLDEVARGRVPFVPEADRDRAAAAARRGIDCLLATQVVVDGRRTVWGQQHDPLTFEVVPARSYELAGLSGRESAAIMTYLMTLQSPNAGVVEAVHAAADWFRATAIYGYEYDFDTGLRAKPGAGPIWARLSEIGTNRPMFANRDGRKLYDWNQLTDRRRGYAWYGTEPGSALEKYAKWARSHPRRAP